MSGYLLDLVTLWALFSAAATVVFFLSKEAGFVHAGAAALMGCGAYASALLSKEWEVDPRIALVGAGLVGFVAGNIIHFILIRLHDDVLALATLAVGIVVHGVMLNAEPFTGGAMGIAAFPRYTPVTGSITLDAVAFLAVLLGAVAWLPTSILGKRIRALREDEELARELGLRPLRVRWFLWTGSSTILALVGGLYAFHLRYIDPSSFTVRESIAILAMAMLIPGTRTANACFGSLVFIAVPEILRFFGLPAVVGAEVRQLLFGLALLVVVARSGMVSQRSVVTGGHHA